MAVAKDFGTGTKSLTLVKTAAVSVGLLFTRFISERLRFLGAAVRLSPILLDSVRPSQNRPGCRFQPGE